MNANTNETTPESAKPVDYADRIRQERQKRAWTQEFLAEKSGLSPRTIQRLECGESPSPETLKLLAGAFGVDAKELAETSRLRTIFAEPGARKSLRNLIVVSTLFTLLDIALFSFDSYFTLPPIGEMPLSTLSYVMIPCCLFLWVIIPFAVITGFAIKDGEFLINYIGWARHFDLAKVTAVGRCPKLGSYSGGAANLAFFRSAFIAPLKKRRKGKVWLYYSTNPDNTVFIEFGNDTVVLSTDAPNALVRSLRESASTLTEREIGEPESFADFTVGVGDYSGKIQSERENRGWTQAELAGKTGLSTRTIQRLEKGTPPSAETVRRLAAAFGIPVAEMKSPVPRRTFRALWPNGRTHMNNIFYFLIYVFPFSVFAIDHAHNMFITYACLIFYMLMIPIASTRAEGFKVRCGKLIVFKQGNVPLKTYDLSCLSGVEITPQALTGSIPLTYPFNIFTPIRHSPVLGIFRAYVTDPAHCVVMEFGKKKIVVTPDDPQAFVEAVREELKALEDAEARTVAAPPAGM